MPGRYRAGLACRANSGGNTITRKSRWIAGGIAVALLLAAVGAWRTLTSALPERVWRLYHDEQGLGPVPSDDVIYTAPSLESAVHGVSALTGYGLRRVVGPFVVLPDHPPRWHAWVQKIGFDPALRVGPEYAPTGEQVDEEFIFWREYVREDD